MYELCGDIVTSRSYIEVLIQEQTVEGWMEEKPFITLASYYCLTCSRWSAIMDSSEEKNNNVQSKVSPKF